MVYEDHEHKKSQAFSFAKVCAAGAIQWVRSMVIMLIGFVAIRQFYLYILTRYISNTPQLVGFGYPVGWMATCVIEILYFILRWKNEGAKKTKAA